MPDIADLIRMDKELVHVISDELSDIEDILRLKARYMTVHRASGEYSVEGYHSFKEMSEALNDILGEGDWCLEGIYDLKLMKRLDFSIIQQVVVKEDSSCSL